MKKIVVLLISLVVFGTATIFAANTTVKPQTIHATQDTTVTYGGIKIFIPAGQTVMLWKHSDGSVLIRGIDLNGVKVAGGVISAPGSVILSVQPRTHVLSVVRGEKVTVQGANQHLAVLSRGASVSTTDIRLAVSPTLTATDSSSTQDTVLSSFVAQTGTSNTASEQATQDVTETDETLSPSAPR